MTERQGLRWEPWPVEEGASRAVGLSGNSYVARPQEDGRFALFYGGLHIGGHGDAAGCIDAADRFETSRTTRGPKP